MCLVVVNIGFSISDKGRDGERLGEMEGDALELGLAE